jgi:hypothetical protein
MFADLKSLEESCVSFIDYTQKPECSDCIDWGVMNADLRATHFCPSCLEYLCPKCVETHKWLKAHRRHFTFRLFSVNSTEDTVPLWTPTTPTNEDDDDLTPKTAPKLPKKRRISCRV